MDLQTFKYKFIDYDMTAITTNWLLERKPVRITQFKTGGGYIENKFKNLDEALEFEIDNKKVKEYIEAEGFKFTMDLIAPNWPNFIEGDEEGKS